MLRNKRRKGDENVPQKPTGDQKPQTVENTVYRLKQQVISMRLQKLQYKEGIEQLDEQIVGAQNQIRAYEDALRLTQAKNSSSGGGDDGGGDA